MKREVYNTYKHGRKSSLLTGILFSLTGGIFTATGIALFVIVLKGITEEGIAAVGAGIIMPIVLITALLGFGVCLLIIGVKCIYLRILKAVTFRYGREIQAEIIDYNSVSLDKGGNLRMRYSVTLAYNIDGENKTFTTDCVFDVNEFAYLKKLDKINVKTRDDFVVVCERFPEDIYKVDPVYGIDYAFFRQKPVTVLLRLWIAFFIAATVFLTVSFFIGNSAVTLSAIIIVFSVHFPFVIPLAVYLIKWITRKK